MARTYVAEDGRAWEVTLAEPGRILGVPLEMDRSGARTPGEAIYIEFTAGDERLSEEYTGLTLLEELSDDDLKEWFDAAWHRRETEVMDEEVELTGEEMELTDEGGEGPGEE